MKPGEVWILRCVGLMTYTVVLRVDKTGFYFLGLEDGVIRRWKKPTHGYGVGEWHQWRPS